MTFAFDTDTLREIGKLAGAYILALPVGWYREREAHTIGLRTFPLVSVAACGYVLLGQPAGQASPDVQSRIIQGLVTGIGFIGGGAILKNDSTVHGAATAAAIWSTGVVGAAVAEDRWAVAAALALLTLLTLRVLMPLKERLYERDKTPGPPGRLDV
jgi:putative Mg2+ transporter-C (MgtC) family protein